MIQEGETVEVWVEVAWCRCGGIEAWGREDVCGQMWGGVEKEKKETR